MFETVVAKLNSIMKIHSDSDIECMDQEVDLPRLVGRYIIPTIARIVLPQLYNKMKEVHWTYSANDSGEEEEEDE